MFISNKLVFVELHKTGCTHIGKVLASLIEGQQRGKHNPPPPALLDSQRHFLGSVRNPWDWYVSLWAYGCDKKGLVYHLTTQPLTGEPRDRRPAANPEKWRACYTSVNDVKAFRLWLQLMNDKHYYNDFGEAYGINPASEHIGLMSFRYLSLFCRHVPWHIGSLDDIRNYEEKNCFIDHFIHIENLERDLLAALLACEIKLSSKQVNEIYSIQKTNTSSRQKEITSYYDPQSIELVRQRESIIIDKFGYQAP